MLRLLTPLAFCSLLLASCTRNDAEPVLEGKWVSLSETDYSYWPTGEFIHADEPFPIIGKLHLDITPDSIIYLDARAASQHFLLRRAYTRQDTMLLIRGSNQKMHIKKLTADTLLLVLRGASSQYTRVDVGYTFTR